MTEQNFAEILVAERDWRVLELEFCLKIPFLYTNALFRQHVEKFWRLCVPIIYAHWEGFVVLSLKSTVDYINDQNIPYNRAARSLLLLDNKTRFGYLQGNCTIIQQTRFLDEFLSAQANGIALERSNISANSNLNFEQLEKMLGYFGINISEMLLSNKQCIEKLVWYRNSIAHGENSIKVVQKDIEAFIACNLKCYDEIIRLLTQYVINKNYYIL